jgi:hypothetical protein
MQDNLVSTPSVKFANRDPNASNPEKKQRLALRTDAATLNAENDYPLEPTSAVNLKGSRGGHLDKQIEEDIQEYETQQKEFRKKNKWSMFSMMYTIDFTSATNALQLGTSDMVDCGLAFRHLASSDKNGHLLDILAYIAVANLTITIIVRNELLLAGLYYSFNFIPFWKFQFHRMLHSIGGLHVGASIATFVWILVYMTTMYSKSKFHGTPQEWTLYVTVALLALCLFLMIVTALRPIRERYHNLWEYTHRFVGWFSLLVLVIHVSARASMQSAPIGIFETPLPYLTIACLVSVFYVWFTVRKVHVQTSTGTGVAIIKFPGRPTMKDGTFARVSKDFLQWHAFSVAMTDLNKPDFAIIVRAAGDWTRDLVDSISEGLGPEKMWIRGVNPPGFVKMHRTSPFFNFAKDFRCILSCCYSGYWSWDCAMHSSNRE